MKERLSTYAWVAPALALVAATGLIPLASTFWISLHRRHPIFGLNDFIGLGNYAQLCRDPRFLRSLATTAYFAGLSVAVEFALGLAAALALWRDFRGHRWVMAAMLVPWIIPTAVSARMWEWIYNAKYGVLNHLLLSAGVAREPVVWVGSTAWALHAAILADVWKTTPFMALLLLAGLKAIPENLYRAAAVDGAGALATFRHVTWAHLRPMVLVALLFRVLDALRVFDVVYVLTGGGPAGTTEVLSVLAYKKMFQSLELGYGSAIGFLVFLLAACVSGAAVLLIRASAAGSREAA